ncbi:aminotransferase class I/II-fold pyridoxal phosphate-dependent enzyme [Streptomyces sp. NPDC056948]|uniref:aminotransferase class I/II-fold pyridoxal phosphate-dependent enzyme n=1 Tax=Streptomyces sp. NPDC056948 TaxID=3345975 RepID=UPI0036449006
MRVTTDGWDLNQLKAAFTAARGHLAYLVPDFHNPTGALMPEDIRRAVADLATRNQVTLVADETMRDLDLRDRPEPAPRIRGAVLIGSTSKAIWAGLRIATWKPCSIDGAANSGDSATTSARCSPTTTVAHRRSRRHGRRASR